MEIQQLINRLLDAKPTDQVIIKIGNITNRDVKINEIAFRNIDKKMYVKIPETQVDYFD